MAKSIRQKATKNLKRLSSTGSGLSSNAGSRTRELAKVAGSSAATRKTMPRRKKANGMARKAAAKRKRY